MVDVFVDYFVEFVFVVFVGDGFFEVVDEVYCGFDFVFEVC